METIVAIPVKNEADRIGDCLRALDAQRGAPPPRVLLLLNDCTDGTELRVRELLPELSIKVDAISIAASPGLAGAGFARSAAMARAASLAPKAVLLTTDADGRVATDWMATNLRAIRAGAEAVAGQAVIDPVEALAIPEILHEADARECHYAALLDHMAALIDPDPADPWPRHTEHSGASIAVTPDAFRRAGGMPPIALGEDREFFAALRRVDARIRHAPEVKVVVSGRIHGRAAGGMADTIRRRMIRPDPMLDDRLEPALHAARRARLRQMLRLHWRKLDICALDLETVAARLGLPVSTCRNLLDRPCFGEAMAAIEALSPRLRRLTLRVEQLPTELDRAGRILSALQAARQDRAPRADTDRSAAVALG